MTSSLRTGIVALIAIAFSTADSWAAKGAVKVTGARLTLADKKVSVAGQPVASGTAVAPGETVVTGRGSHAELTLPDGTVIRIGQGSSFTYAGSKLVLNQGTALVRVAHKNTTVVSGSRTYSGGPAVVSMQAAKGSDGLYILQGTGKVNGASLIAGQSSVLDHGKDRTFTFDLQKLEGSSALVTKFPQTPWIAQAQSLATIQHQLLTTKITPTDKPGKGAPAGISPSVATRDIVSSGLASQIGAGAGGRSVAFQVTGSPVSLGANATAFIKSAAIASSSGGTLTLNSSSGGSGIASGSNTFTNAVNAVNAGTLNLNQGGTITIVGGNTGTIPATGAIGTGSTPPQSILGPGAGAGTLPVVH
ncbi:MAG: FecR domain-containing protein [Verrucomicrobiota bacterium]